MQAYWGENKQRTIPRAYIKCSLIFSPSLNPWHVCIFRWKQINHKQRIFLSWFCNLVKSTKGNALLKKKSFLPDQWLKRFPWRIRVRVRMSGKREKKKYNPPIRQTTFPLALDIEIIISQRSIPSLIPMETGPPAQHEDTNIADWFATPET